MRKSAKTTTLLIGSQSRTSSHNERAALHAHRNLSEANRILALQGAVGNRAVQGLINSPAIQRKLHMGRRDDIFEREADLAEEAVEETPAQIQPRATPISPPFQDDRVEELQEEEETEEEEADEFLQPKRAEGQTAGVAPDLASGIRELEGRGRPLPPSTRGFFEERLGFDFMKVRVHTSARAGSLARALNAQAFTWGQDVVFDNGKYSPETDAGRKLLAHELTHVVQQNRFELRPRSLQRQSGQAAPPTSYFQDPRKAVKRYGTLKNSLNRELRRIKRTRNKRTKKARQIKFLRKIYGRVLGYDPFETIDVMPLQAVQKIIQRKGQTYKITTSHNAVTELVDPKNKDKVKVTFNEEIFKDSLESIITTALHESVHARQLMGGVPARTFHYGPRKDYYAAVNALSELEAYTIEVHSPFFGKLSRQRQKQLKSFLRQADKKARAAVNKLNLNFPQYQSFQYLLSKLVPKYKGLRGWFKRHPLPWG